MTHMEQFGASLRRTRRALSITQAQLAERIGVDPSYISRIERDLVPSRKIIESILEALEITNPAERARFLVAAGQAGIEEVRELDSSLVPGWRLKESRKLLEAIEELLERCVNDGRLEHLEDFYAEFPFYRDIRRGRALSLPSRADIMRIADYLQSTLPERNSLLIAANYALVPDPVTGPLIESALKTAEKIIDDLPFPAFAITQDDTLHYWNEIGLSLFNTSDEEELKRPKENRNILRYIFDPTTPVYDVFTNWRRNFVWHRYTCRLNILRFKRNNVLYQYDQWYRDRVNSLMDLPEFKDTWEKIQIGNGFEEIRKEMPSGMEVPEYVTNIYTRYGDELRIRGLQIDYTGWGFPLIMVYTYDGEEGRRIFAKLGLPTPDNGWKGLKKGAD